MEGPDISEYYSGGSGNTLKPHDIDDELEVVVKSHRVKKWDDGSTTVYLQLEDMDQEFRVNKTNADRIAEMYGTKILGWYGKTLNLIVDKVKTPQGGKVDSIIVRVRKMARNAPKPAAKHDDRNPPHPLDDEIPF